MWMGNRLVVYVDDPERVKTFLSSDKCLDKGYSYRFMREHFRADGLITLPGILFYFQLTIKFVQRNIYR